MSETNTVEQGEIATQLTKGKLESKKIKNKKQVRESRPIGQIFEESKSKDQQKAKVKTKETKKVNKQQKNKQKQDKKQNEKPTKTKKRRRRPPSTPKQKKIKKKKQQKSRKKPFPILNKKDLYDQQQLEDKNEDRQKSLSNQNNFTASQIDQDEVKHELQNSSQSDQANIHQIYMAQKLHAFRQQLQINEIMRNNQQDVKLDKNLQLKMKDSVNQDDTPNDSEINYIIKLLGKKQPHINIYQTVSILYKCLIKKDSKGNNCRNLQQQLLRGQDTTANQKYAKLMKSVQGNLRALADKSNKNIVKRYIKNPKQEQKFQRDEDRAKFSEKQIVARAFCQREYGMPGLLQEIRESGAKIIIERNRYKSIVTCVVNEAYRKLQDFLIEQCKRDIKPLNREEIRTLFTTLLNCKVNFEDEQYLTFIKFIKLAFQVQSVTITEESAIKLYIIIQRALKLRIGELQLDRICDTMRCNKEFKARRSFQNQKFQIHRIWNNQLESQFLNFYKKNQEFAKIRDHFKSKYVQNQHLFTIDSLRSRFYKTMRMALRKTNCFCQKFGQERVPQMIKLNDIKVKFLLRSPDALPARMLLVDMYLNDECDIKRLYQTVSSVNEFIIMKDNERMNQMIEAEPLFNSAAKKIQHNVNISKSKAKVKSQSNQQLYYKGKEMNYDHIVQTANGKNLHYYRKPAENQLTDFKNKQIKVQDAAQIKAKDFTMQNLVNELADQDKWLGSSCASRCGSVSESSMKMNQQSFNKMIQEQMQRFHKKSNHPYSIY